MRRALAVLAPLVAAGCSDPTIAIAIDWTRYPALDPNVTELRITVNTLTDRRCDALARGDVSASDLALGLQTAVAFANDHRAHAIDEVPRLGAKLFVLEGYDGTHRRIVAGCKDHDDIDADLELAIEAKPVVATRVLLDPEQTPSLTLPRDGASGPGDKLTFYAREVAAGHAAFAEDAPFALRTVAHPTDISAGTATLTDAENGVFTGALPMEMPDGADTAVGPVELVLRVPWVERVERLAAFVPAAPLGSVRTVPNDQVNAIRPDWAFVTQATTDGDDVLAAALVEIAGQPRRIAVARENGRALVPVGTITSAVSAEARALARMRTPAASQLVTLTSGGWYAVGPGPALVPVAAGPGMVADELVAMPNCTAPLLDLGLLVRTGARWDGFDTLGPTPAGTDVAVGDLASRLNAFRATFPGADLEDVLCVSSGTEIGVVAIVTVATAGGFTTRYAISNHAAPTLLPFVGAVTFAVRQSGQVDLVGPVATDTGTRAVSYRVKPGSTQLIPDEYVDYPLPGVPSRMIVNKDDGINHPDVLALVAYQGGVTLSVTDGGVNLGDELTALVRTGLTGQSPRFARLPLLEADGDDPNFELVIAGDSGLTAFDMGTSAHAAGQP